MKLVWKTLLMWTLFLSAEGTCTFLDSFKNHIYFAGIRSVLSSNHEFYEKFNINTKGIQFKTGTALEQWQCMSQVIQDENYFYYEVGGSNQVKKCSEIRIPLTQTGFIFEKEKTVDEVKTAEECQNKLADEGLVHISLEEAMWDSIKAKDVSIDCPMQGTFQMMISNNEENIYNCAGDPSSTVVISGSKMTVNICGNNSPFKELQCIMEPDLTKAGFISHDNVLLVAHYEEGIPYFLCMKWKMSKNILYMSTFKGEVSSQIPAACFLNQDAKLSGTAYGYSDFISLQSGQNCTVDYRQTRGTIQSPGYPRPYTPGLTCTLRLHLGPIVTGQNKILRVLVTDFHLATAPNNHTKGDYFYFWDQVYRGNGNPANGYVNPQAMNVGTTLTYEVKDDAKDFFFYSNEDAYGGQGFSIDYEIVNKDEPADGYWAAWAKWSECKYNVPSNCEEKGNHKRNRYCVPPQNGGADCIGVSEETSNNCLPNECTTPVPTTTTKKKKVPTATLR